MKASLFALLVFSMLTINISNAQDSSSSSSNSTLSGDISNPQNNTSNTTTQNDTSSYNDTVTIYTEAIPDTRENYTEKTPGIEDNYFDPVTKQSMIDQYGEGKIQIHILSIEPEGGPTDGETRVLVRGGPFYQMTMVYPYPKCRFGSNSRIVEAAYVPCSVSPIPAKDFEKNVNKNETCLQCADNPPSDKAEIVPLTVSLTGDFSDALDSVAFRYYQTPIIYAIQPVLGYKDGDTKIDVWGENFLNYDELSVCNFGTMSVKAHFINSTRLLCIAPRSDVVGAKIPFSVSFNKQQTTKQNMTYWFYNRPQITAVVPNIGSDTGGYNVTLVGQNLHPILPYHDYHNTSFCLFQNLTDMTGEGVKTRAYAIDSTHISCMVPINNHELKLSTINVTLNDQQYTDDVELIYFFKSPIVYDIDPREGPTKGGTEVIVFGDRFNSSGIITCKFGNKTTKGIFLSSSQIKCISPPTDKQGPVKLQVSNGFERYSSSHSEFYYYDTPMLDHITPACGPHSGYTQISVFGKNFRNIGFGKTKCIFNQTIIMNATIIENNIIKCDSPQLLASMASSDMGAPFYFVSISLDGGKSVTDSNVKFQYYKDPVIEGIMPNKGHVRGGTNSSLFGSGFQQEAACNVTVRYGAITQNITNVTNFTDTQINITSPPSSVPARVVVSVSLNGQQFLNDKVFHLTDKDNIFTYYQDSYISDYSPKAGPSQGNTLVKVNGLCMNQFKDAKGNKIVEPLWVRFLDYQTGQPIGESFPAFDQKDDQFSYRTPPAGLDTKAIMQISHNNQDWQNVIPPNTTYSYQYYNAPKISFISPAYGPVKSPNDETVTITGQNFNCPDSDCKDLFVRFGDPENGIFVKANKTGPNTVECKVPKYTKPDVLPVEVTFNGYDYTNDNQTYGFFDPYILDVQPRLINAKGTTKVKLYGIGFVNSTGTYLKSKFRSNGRGNLTCGTGDCIKMATYIDKTTIQSDTFPQPLVNYQDNNDNIWYDGMATEGCVYGNTFTENGIEIYYYTDPIYQNLSEYGSPANQQHPLYIQTDFQWNINDPERFRKHGNFTCRYKSQTSDKVMYTKARMETYPLGNQDSMAKPTHLKCLTPKWNSPEQVKLDMSVNGQDYNGDYTFTFYDNLDLYRIYPMAGPNEGHTRVLLFGSGFATSKEDVFVKWGILYTEQLQKDQVMNYIWNETQLILSEAEKGNMILKAYKEETYNEKEYYNTKKRDFELYEGQKLVTYYAQSPRLDNWSQTHGGPVYMSVGEKMVLNITNYTLTTDEVTQAPITNITYYNNTNFFFSHSFVEYYYYQSPVVKKVEPSTGLQRGGTRIEVSGAWFKYKPEYGIVPHCKIGDKVSRAQFHSTVRIVCLSPPNSIVDSSLPIFVSLNGFDFVDTGYTFQYQIQTDLFSIYPTSGEEGTTIYIKGSSFQKFPGNSKYKCRFTDIEGNLPPKYEYVYYKDNTTVQCNAPKGYGDGIAARVQVTFNGDDYSDNNFTFYFYKINGVFPNSGPNDGNGGPILVLGDGFRSDPSQMTIVCKFNGTDYAPTKIQTTVVSCPVPAANKSGITFPTRVDFVLQIDSAQKRQEDGFWYYDQIVAQGMEPTIGPSVGKGIINYYVKGLNNSYDYFWANPGCKVGNSQGKGTIVGPVQYQQAGEAVEATLIQCVVEDMELVDKDYYLPATVALNSYSWVDTDFKYVPYGITDIMPNSGPISGNTDVIIVGKGFNEDLQEKALCRFGVGASQVIVQADILDYEQLLCRTPPGFLVPSYADLPVSVPVSITLSDKDQFNPWTETAHRFTFYQPPKLILVEPAEVEIGKTFEVIVFCDDESEFIQPIPTYKDKRPQHDIMCRFGRFKDSIGTFINKTAIKCAVPSLKEDPSAIWREDVKLTIAQNGKDFDEENSDLEVTFVGTGSPLGFWSAILATLLIGLLLVAIVFFFGAWLENWRRPAQDMRNRDRSYVIKDAYDQITSRAYTSGMMGRGSAASEVNLQM